MASDRGRSSGQSGRGLLLVLLVVLIISIGGGVALWSLLREVSFGDAPATPGAAPAPSPGGSPR